MRMFCSVFTVMGVLGATEASAANWNEGAIYAPNGIIAQLERGTVVREDIGEPEPAPIVLAEARKAAKRGASGAAFDGRWSIVISTRSGPCDPQYRFGVRIVNGNITYEGGGAANAQGRVSPNGTVTVSVSSGPQAANGQGRLFTEPALGAAKDLAACVSAPGRPRGKDRIAESPLRTGEGRGPRGANLTSLSGRSRTS